MLSTLAAQSAYAQAVGDPVKIYDIGDGEFVEIYPAKFDDVQMPLDPNAGGTELVTIPATFETVMDTFVVRQEIKRPIIEAAIIKDGIVVTPAKASIDVIPAVTQDIPRRVVREPERIIERSIPVPPPEVIRVIVKEQTAIVRDSDGTEIQRFTDMAKLADYINQK
ncbi:MAG: hypothetical protein AAFP97_10985 [Pseudomonadota bacterium]